MSYPLEGIKVLDMSRVLAGPFAGRMLSDLGADVVKVEPPEGDITRIWGLKVGGMAGYFNQQNAGKRGMCIDLGVPEGCELVKRLAACADVLLENFRPDVMARLGVSYDVLREINPKLIMLSISGFGANGPESRRAAYAPIIHGESGLIERQAQVSGGDHFDIGTSIADTNASLHGLVGLLSALYMRERTGTGQHIDMAMIDAMIVNDDGLHYALEAGKRPMPNEVHKTSAGPLVLGGDFRYIWHCLSTKSGVVDPTPEGAALDEKIAHRRAAAHRFFNETCPDRASVIAALDAMNIAWGDVRSAPDTRELPTVKHRGTFVAVDDRAGGERIIPQAPYRFSAADAGVRPGGAPHLGEHNEAVLEDWLGCSGSDLKRWAPALVSADD